MPTGEILEGTVRDFADDGTTMEERFARFGLTRRSEEGENPDEADTVESFGKTLVGMNIMMATMALAQGLTEEEQEELTAEKVALLVAIAVFTQGLDMGIHLGQNGARESLTD